MANTLTPSSFLGQVVSLSQLPLPRQILFTCLLTGAIALGTVTVMWSQNSGYTPLYAGLSTRDMGDVVAALEQSGLQYKIDNASGNITVPSNRVREARMQLASAGLPRSTSQGFEFLEEEQSLGTSNFVEQARYNRAMEQELVQTIKQIQGVRDARVHLSIPRQNSFIRNSRKPSASVMLDIAGVQQPGDTQLSGILHLVASSVAGMETSMVSIVDQRGNLLSDKQNSELGGSNETIRFTRNIEENYSARIIDILTPIVGIGNVRAQVSANLDFTAMETMEEVYNPETAVIRSEELQEETSDSNVNSGSVEPGTLATTPPPEVPEGQDQLPQAEARRDSRTSTIRNFELDRSVSQIRTMPGAIEQLSVAVLVDLQAGTSVAATPDAEAEQITPEQVQARIDRLTLLVKDAIGFNEARGDSVNVINEQFFVMEPIAMEEIPLWEQDWFYVALKQGAAGLVVILLIFAVLRPALKAAATSQGASSSSKQLTQQSNESVNDELAPDQVSLSKNLPLHKSIGTPGEQKLSYDQNLIRAQNLVLQEPTRAARMIQNWLASE